MKCWRYLGAKRLAKTPSANQGTNRNQVMFISTDVLAVNLQKARPYQKFGSLFVHNCKRFSSGQGMHPILVKVIIPGRTLQS